MTDNDKQKELDEYIKHLIDLLEKSGSVLDNYGFELDVVVTAKK